MTVIKAVDCAVGQREMRHTAKERGRNALAFKIKRGDCRHRSGCPFEILLPLTLTLSP